MLDPVLLRSFVAVVDCGNFTRAAERLMPLLSARAFVLGGQPSHTVTGRLALAHRLFQRQPGQRVFCGPGVREQPCLTDAFAEYFLCLKCIEKQ